jgi:hypothetical protein
MVRSPRPAPVGQCRPLTLEERVEQLASRFERKAAEDQQRAKGVQSEASYHYGLADAFEVVATMLREALTEAGGGES